MTGRRRITGRDPGNLVFGTIGWLFADLMFALAMAFLVATTVGQPAPAKPRPSPTRTPTPSPQRGLESRPVSITTKVDWQGLLSGDSSAKAALKRKVRAKKALDGRQAGLVLSFGGGLDRGTEIAQKADAVLKELGDQGFVFQGTVYRPYISFGSSPNKLTLDIYLFKK
jgi:hypothetical protein